MKQQTHSNWALLVATGIALGVAVPLGKLAVGHGVAPVSFAMFPALFAGLLLAAVAWWRHGPPASVGRLLLFGLASGLLGNAIPNALTAWLAAGAGASFAAIAFTLPPVFTWLLSLLLGFEVLRWQRLAAVGLGLAGASWLVSGRVGDGAIEIGGAIALFAIPVAIASGNIYRARCLPSGVAAEWLGAAMTLGAFGWLLPLWLFGPVGMSAISSAGLPHVAAQACCAAIAALLFFRLQRRAEPVAMSFVGYVLALTGVLLGAVLLDEHLPAQLLPAAALIAAGFWMLQRQAQAPAAPALRTVAAERSGST